MDQKNVCPYCFKEVTHCPRHLERNHKDEGGVQKLLALPPKDSKREVLLDAMRRQGNFLNSSQDNRLRPVRRPKITKKLEKNVDEKFEDKKINYIACNYCLGYLKKKRLRRHGKRCTMRSKT